MAKDVYTFLVMGLSLELQPWDSASGDWKTEKTALCGIDSIGFADGQTEEKTVTDFCYAAKYGQHRKLAGLKDPGELTLNVVNFDPDDAGQKLVADAEVNSRFKLTITLPWEGGSNKTLTFELSKKNEAGFEIKLGEQMTSSLSFSVIGKPLWT